MDKWCNSTPQPQSDKRAFNRRLKRVQLSTKSNEAVSLFHTRRQATLNDLLPGHWTSLGPRQNTCESVG